MRKLRFAGMAAAAVLLGACGSSHERATTTLPSVSPTTAAAVRSGPQTKTSPIATTTSPPTAAPSPKPSAAQLAQVQSQLAQVSADLTGASADIAGADVNAAKGQEGSAP
jgi:hypothetical protein